MPTDADRSGDHKREAEADHYRLTHDEKWWNPKQENGQ